MSDGGRHDVDVKTQAGVMLRKGKSQKEDDELTIDIGADSAIQEAIAVAVRCSPRDLSATTAKIDRITGAKASIPGTSSNGGESPATGSASAAGPSSAGSAARPSSSSSWGALLADLPLEERAAASEAVAVAAAAEAEEAELEAAAWTEEQAEAALAEAEAEAEAEESGESEDDSEASEEESSEAEASEVEKEADAEAVEELSSQGEAWGSSPVVSIREAVALGLISSDFTKSWWPSQ